MRQKAFFFSPESEMVSDNVIENSVYQEEVNAFEGFHYYGLKLFTDYLHTFININLSFAPSGNPRLAKRSQAGQTCHTHVR